MLESFIGFEMEAETTCSRAWLGWFRYYGVRVGVWRSKWWSSRNGYSQSPLGNVSDKQRHGVALFVDDVADAVADVLIGPEPAGAAVAGPAVTGRVVEIGLVEAAGCV